jgi:hypothetical protein
MPSRLLPALLLAACCGCRPAPVTPGSEQTGSVTWSMPADGSGVPGLDGGSCYFIGSRFVVWAADGRGGGGGSSTSGSAGTKGDGYVLLNGGRKVAFNFTLPAGGAGKATVDGTDFDLAKGRLFLVKPAGDKLEVRQVDAELPGWNAGSPDMAAVGRATPEIKTFFEPAK